MTSRVARQQNCIGRNKTLKLNKEEKEIDALFESDEIVLTKPDKKLLGKLRSAADSTFKKDRRINIRLSERDMVGIQRVAAAKGVPYQSLISGLIHQYVEGDLVQKS
jgi:predicted DNA binding CopG/RHH family protein